MQIIKKKKLKRLKACKRACNLIYEVIQESKEDHHGNVIPYQNDKIIRDILDILENVNVGVEKPVIAATMDDFDYQLPWPVGERKA